MAILKIKDGDEWKEIEAIKGDAGPAGYTPQKGVDYFTEEDIQEIESEVTRDFSEVALTGDYNDLINKPNLSTYSLITETGSKIDLEINSTTFVLTAKLYDKNNNLVSTSAGIDLPLESVVVGANYDSTNKKIVLTLQNGTTIDVPVGDLVNGLQAEITSSNKLSADLVDDTTTTNKFVSTNEKTTWSGKQDALISGTNIKTINNNSLLGSGNINISGGGSSDYEELTNLPKVNSVELKGNKSLSDLGIQPAGNYLTSESDPIFSASAASGISSSDITNWDNKSDFSGSYNDLSNKPTIPSKTSDLTNDSDFPKTFYMRWGQTYTLQEVLAKESAGYEFRCVNNYSEVIYNIDVFNASGITFTNPTKTGVNYYTYSFTNNTWSSGSVSSPTKTSDLTNDSGFIDNTYHDSSKQDSLVSGTNIKTINNNSILGSGNIDIQSGGTATNVKINGTSITSNDEADIQTEGTYNASTNKIATMSDLPTVPTKTSDLTNDSGFVSSSSLSTVATSGSYSDLSNKPTIPDELSDLSDDSTHRLVTDAEKTTWSGKQDALVSGTNIKTINSNSVLGSGNIDVYGEALPIGTEVDYDGSTVPDGWVQIDSPEDYSTSEIKTNKVWIDNKPVYRRVFMYNNIALSSSTQLDAVIANLDSIFKADFYYRLSQSEIRPFPTLASNGTSLLQARWSENKIRFTGSDSWATGSDRYLIAIIEYTKTTD